MGGRQDVCSDHRGCQGAAHAGVIRDMKKNLEHLGEMREQEKSNNFGEGVSDGGDGAVANKCSYSNPL